VRVPRSLARVAALALLAGAAAAHDGPPYPILVDGSCAGRALTVWADPDVGVGTFYLYFPEEEQGLDPDVRVSVTVQPQDGRLPEVSVPAEPADAGRPYQRIALAEFDARGWWKVRFVVESPAGADAVELDVEVTPPGLGRIDLLWFGDDFSGTVDARYATVDPSLHDEIRTVTRRLYRGFCRDELVHEQAVAAFREHRDEIPQLYRDVAALGYAQFGPEEAEDAIEYFEGFWEVVDDAGRFEREITRKCRPW